ncbi:hypothetical protein [Paenibacillus sp. MMS18-CY102]|uniref:hypothetical protein n=1 Tax=Paenibacillus sp. MMS18-CY102 TaxID=2682849 RepID=UPI001365F8CB|nr:hypothetical protein [Paenibacillus sp. MMS18-CY102]MWC27778.1 hypothetical protein [Paenibacillus sp. MMS18-CY102]
MIRPSSTGSNRLSPLLRLEMSGFTRYFPTSLLMAARWLAGMLIALAACQLAFKDHYPPTSIYVLGAMLSWFVSLTFAVMRTAMQSTNPFREWALTLPQPRTAIARARIVAVLSLNGLISGAVWLVVTFHALLSAAWTESPFYSSPGDILIAAIAYAAVYAGVTLLLTSLGMLVATLMQGWRQLLLLLVLILWSVPFSFIGGMEGLDAWANDWLDAPMAFLYGAGTLAIGWLAYRLAISLVAKHGLLWAITAQNRYKDASKQPAQASAAAARAGKRRFAGVGIRSFYELERSKFKFAATITWVRIVYVSLLLILAVGGYFALPDNNLVQMVKFLFIFAGIAANTVLTTQNTMDMSSRRIEWLFSFPYSRVKLMLVRTLATWVSMFAWLTGALLAIAFGAAVRYAVNPPVHISNSSAWEALAYLCLAFFLYTVIISLFCFIQYVPSIGLLVLPVIIGVYFGPLYLIEYVLPDSLRTSGVSDARWIGLLLFGLIGLPIAWLGFIAGARNSQAHLLGQQDKQAKKGGSIAG